MTKFVMMQSRVYNITSSPTTRVAMIGVGIYYRFG